MLEIRLRARISPEEMEAKVGKIITDRDYNVLLTRECKILKPNGQTLCVYRPGAITEARRQEVYPILTTIREVSDNRGHASGAKRVVVGGTNRAAPVMSSVVGYFEASGGGRFPACRLTAWTGRHIPEFHALRPFIQDMAELFRANVPDRYAVQKGIADATHPDWVIPGTPYSTLTINNTYPTGVHKDAGDLPEGFSSLCVLRRGHYTGGVLVFPEYRVAVNMGDGDAIFMDAHEWHGNTKIVPQSEDAERISTVLYYRTKIQGCASGPEELKKAQAKGGTL